LTASAPVGAGSVSLHRSCPNGRTPDFKPEHDGFASIDLLCVKSPLLLNGQLSEPAAWVPAARAGTIRQMLGGSSLRIEWAKPPRPRFHALQVADPARSLGF
jgi:hypothetical protein